MILVEGMVGKSEGGNDNSIWTHKKLEIGYNGQQIVDVNLTSEGIINIMIMII